MSDYSSEYDQQASHSEDLPDELKKMYGEDISGDEGDFTGEENDYSGEEGEYEVEYEQEGEDLEEQDSQLSENDVENDEEYIQLNNFNEQLRKIGQYTEDKDKFKQQIMFLNNQLKKENKQLNDNQQFISKNQYKQQFTNEEYLQQDQDDMKKQLNQLQKALIENNTSFMNQFKVLKNNKNSSLKFDKGIGFFNAKSLIFQEYMINLHFYLLKKIQGQPLDSEFVKKLLYQKTLLQKMKPVEKKLDYQVQKLLKLSQKQTKSQNDNDKVYNPYADDEEISDSEQGKVKGKTQKDTFKDVDEDIDDTENPYAFKPNPENLDNNESSDDDQDQNQVKKYKASKIVSTLPKEEKQLEAQKRREQNRMTYLRRQLAENFIQDDDRQRENKNQQYTEKKLDRWEEEREKFEMENFIRLPTTKKDKIREKQLKKKKQHTEDRLDDFTEERQMRELLAYEGVIDKEKRQKQHQKKFNKNEQNSSDFGGKSNFKKRRVAQPSKKIIKKRR
ncbi:hypothetical protein PPERSA_11408 [Pseudocohnilembus persalinus]|uniref:Sas10 C-terminal domain-containing protein n=1 Tax=Pseudocohnilembus persalinus TaxID=266149 RepID=A0A0V0QQ46_PSEPJ|nr:hypothetical protein PPERSA_11408 [Pseudocohnilembus persalinus]|eukprot:KRX04284.1 hypothetical protein PPERSA_11408 [Pseudocohnilembus persalinus]